MSYVLDGMQGHLWMWMMLLKPAQSDWAEKTASNEGKLMVMEL